MKHIKLRNKQNKAKNSNADFENGIAVFYQQGSNLRNC